MSQLEHSGSRSSPIARPMRIRFACTACSFTANVGPDYAGKAIRCPNCSAPQLVDDPTKPTATNAATAVVTAEGVLFACSGCGYQAKLGIEYLGQVISCPRCSAVRIVATDMGQPTVVAPEPPAAPHPARPRAPAASSRPTPLAARGRPAASRPAEFTCILCGHQSRISPSTVGGNIYCPSCGEAQPLTSPTAEARGLMLAAPRKSPAATAPVTPEARTIMPPAGPPATPAPAAASATLIPTVVSPAGERRTSPIPPARSAASVPAATAAPARKAVNRKVMPANWDLDENADRVRSVGIGRRVITASTTVLLRGLVRIATLLFAEVRAKNRAIERLRRNLASEQQRREFAEVIAAGEARRRRAAEQRTLLRETLGVPPSRATCETQIVPLAETADAPVAEPVTRSTAILDSRLVPTTQPRARTSALEAAVATGLLAVRPTIADEAPPLAPAGEQVAEPVTSSTTIHHFAPTTQPHALSSALQTTVVESEPAAPADPAIRPACGDPGDLFCSEAPPQSDIALTKKRRKTTAKARRSTTADGEGATTTADDAKSARAAASGRKSTSRTGRKKTDA